MTSTTSAGTGSRTAVRDPAARGRHSVRRIEVAVAVAVGALGLIGGLATLLARGGTAPDLARLPARTAYPPFVADLHGTVEIRPAGQPGWRPLRATDTFATGDAIRTGPDGHCDVLVAWGASFRVLEGSEARWRRLERDGTGLRVELELVAGRVLPAMGGLPKGSRFELRSPAAEGRATGPARGAGGTGLVTQVSTLAGFGESVDRTDPTRRVPGIGDDLLRGGGGVVAAAPTEAETAAAGGPDPAARAAGTGGTDPATGLPGIPGSRPATADPRGPGPVATGPARPGAGPVRAVDRDEEAVRTLCTRGIELLDDGRVNAALDLCTPGFRAQVDGSFAVVSGVSGSSEIPRAGVVSAAARVGARLALRLRVESLSVVVDKDLAYASGTVTATATVAGSVRPVVRRYGCIVRCVRSEGRWLVDLATAGEGG